MIANTVTHSGWLQKKGESSLSFMRSWTRTWALLEGDRLKLFTGPADIKSTPKSDFSLMNARLTVKDNPKHEHYFEIQLSGKADGHFLRFSAPSQIALLEWLSRLERGRDKKIIPGIVIERGPLSDPDINGSFSPVSTFSPPAFTKRSAEPLDPVPKMASISDVAIGLAKAIKKDSLDTKQVQVESKITNETSQQAKRSSITSSSSLPIPKITSLAGAAIGLAKAVTQESKEIGTSGTRLVDTLRKSNEVNESEEDAEFETPLTPIHESSSPGSSEKQDNVSRKGGQSPSFSQEEASLSSSSSSRTAPQNNLRTALGLSPVPSSLEKSREPSGVSPNSRLESSGLSASYLNMTVMQSPPVTLKLSTATASQEEEEEEKERPVASASMLESSPSLQQTISGRTQIDGSSAVSLSMSPPHDSSPLRLEDESSANNRFANRPASPEADLVASDWQQQDNFQHDIKRSHHIEDKHVALFMSDEIMSGLLYILESKDGRFGHLTEKWMPRFALLETATCNGQDRPDGTGSGSILRLYTQTGPTDLRESEMIQVSICKAEAVPRRQKSPRSTSCFVIRVESIGATYMLASPLSGDHLREEWIANLNDPPAPAPRQQLPEKLFPNNTSSLIQDTPIAPLLQEEVVKLASPPSSLPPQAPPPPPPPPPPPLPSNKVTKLAPSLPSHPLFAAAAAGVVLTSSARSIDNVVLSSSIIATNDNKVDVSTRISDDLTPTLSSIDALVPTPAHAAAPVVPSHNSQDFAKGPVTTFESLPPPPPPSQTYKPIPSPAAATELASSVLQFSGLDFDDLDDLEESDDKINSTPAENVKQGIEEEVNAAPPLDQEAVNVIYPIERKVSIDSEQQSHQVNVFSPQQQDSKVFSPQQQDSKVFSPQQQDSKVFSPQQQERSSFDMDMMYPISPPSLLSTTSEASPDKLSDRIKDVGVMAVEEIETVEAIMVIDDSRLESPTPDFPISPTIELEFTRYASNVQAGGKEIVPPAQSFSPLAIPASPGSQSFYSAGGQLGEEDDEEQDSSSGSPQKAGKGKIIPQVARNSTLLKPTAASQSRATETKKMFDSHSSGAASPLRLSLRSSSPTAPRMSNSSFRSSNRSSASPAPSAHRLSASPAQTNRLLDPPSSTASSSPIALSPPLSARRRLVQRGQGSPIPELSAAKRLVGETPLAPDAFFSFDPFTVEFPDVHLSSQQQEHSSPFVLSKSSDSSHETAIAAARHAAAEAALAELFGKPIKTLGSTLSKKGEEELHQVREAGFPSHDFLKRLDVDAISQRINRIGANLDLESKQQHFDESVIFSTVSSSARSVDLRKDAGPVVSRPLKSSLTNAESSSSVSRGRRVQRRGGIKVGLVNSSSRSPSTRVYPTVYSSSTFSESHTSSDGGRSRGRSLSNVPAAGATREARAAAETVVRRSLSQSRSPSVKSPHLVPTVLLGGVSGSEKYMGGNSVSRTQRAMSIERARAKVRGTVLVQRGKGEALRPEWKGGRW